MKQRILTKLILAMAVTQLTPAYADDFDQCLFFNTRTSQSSNETTVEHNISYVCLEPLISPSDPSVVEGLEFTAKLYTREFGNINLTDTFPVRVTNKQHLHRGRFYLWTVADLLGESESHKLSLSLSSNGRFGPLNSGAIRYSDEVTIYSQRNGAEPQLSPPPRPIRCSPGRRCD